MKKNVLLMTIILALILVGCGSNSNDRIVETKVEENTSIQTEGKDRTILERSEELSDFIVELFGVDDVSTIIFNDTALVGLVMSHNNKLTQDIKKLISEMVMENDSSISQVLISDDNRIFNEIIYIIDDLMNGKSYDSHVLSINKMIEKVKEQH